MTRVQWSPTYYLLFSSVFFLLLSTTLSYKTPIMYFEWRWQSDFRVSILGKTILFRDRCAHPPSPPNPHMLIHVTKYKVRIFYSLGDTHIPPIPHTHKHTLKTPPHVNTCDKYKVRIFYSLGDTPIPPPHQTLTTATAKMTKSPILWIIKGKLCHVSASNSKFRGNASS